MRCLPYVCHYNPLLITKHSWIFKKIRDKETVFKKLRVIMTCVQYIIVYLKTIWFPSIFPAFQCIVKFTLQIFGRALVIESLSHYCFQGYLLINKYLSIKINEMKRPNRSEQFFLIGQLTYYPLLRIPNSIIQFGDHSLNYASETLVTL